MPDNNSNDKVNEPVNQPMLEPEVVPEQIDSPEAVGMPVEQPLPDDVPIVYSEDNKFKYLILGVIFLVVFGGIFFGLYRFFLNRAPASPEKVKLTYWGLWDDKNIMEPLIKEYMSKNPNVEIVYELKDVRDNYREKLIARAQKGVGPDIFRYHISWIPEISEVLSYAPDKIISEDEFRKIYFRSIQESLIIDGRIYGIPLMIDGLVLIYNEDLLKAANINIVPSTWDELLEAIQKLTVKDTNGQIITSGIALGTAGNIQHFSDIFLLMLYQNGGDIANLASQEAVDILSQYRRFAEEPENVWDESMPDSVAAFAQGKVAMIFAPSWQMLIIRQLNPEINMKAAPVPQVPGADPISIASYWVEGVSRMSKNQAEAWKFLKFLSEKEQMQRLYETQAQYRLFGTAFPRRDLAENLKDNPYLSAVIRQADYFFTTYGISRTYDNGLNDEIIQYIENAINAAAQGVSYREAMQTADEGVKQVLQRYNIKF